MSIFLLSPKAQPFGLLSNKANVMMTIEGTVWESVSQYVFVNMFKNENTRFEMSQRVYRDPYITMETLKNKEDFIVFEQEILKGLRIRFSQYPALRARLFQTRGKELVYDDLKIVSLLNNIRSETTTIFDPLRGVEIPREEVLSVIAGVEKEILQNPYLDENLLYTDLIPYAIKNPQPLPYGDIIFVNVNNIVPVLKYRLRQKIWENEIKKFKEHLLDVYLDYLLETEYPNINKIDYKKAKNQQIMKEKNIEKYENQLYDLYLTNEIDYLVTKRLLFRPDKSLEEMTQKEKEIELLMKSKEDDGVLKIIIEKNDPFLPNYPEKIVVNGKNFNTVIHYAYFKLLQIIGMTNEININSVHINNLQEMYDNMKHQWINKQLKLNNETATIAKFKQNNILFHLLVATGNDEIIWNDKSDPILGIGYNRDGDNLSGRFLDFLKNNPGAFGLQIRNKLYSSVKNNIWDHWRITQLAQDYQNTLKLLKTPTTRDLEIIYKINGKYDDLPSEQEINLLKKAGLNIDEINIIFPLISASYANLNKLTEKQVIENWVEENEKIKSKPNIQKAKENLKLIFNNINADVSEKTFIASILANKQTDSFEDSKWQRIKFWS